MSNLYNNYKDKILMNADIYCIQVSEFELNNLCHSTQWLFRMPKSKLGSSLLCFTPKSKNKKLGRLLYRNGIDIFESFHSFLVCHNEEVEQLNKDKQIMSDKISALILEQNKKNDPNRILKEASVILRNTVKYYVSEKVKPQELPNIHNFDCMNEIHNIPSILWNFLNRVTATEREDKNLKKSNSWDTHYLGEPLNISRALPRLYIASCIFNTQNSQCVHPLHMLLTDISDTFSNSSSVFLSINARLGAGVSKDYLKRFISNKCSELEKSNKFLTSSSFTLASFDKSSAYSIVGIGRDRQLYHALL
jgi:hypothetical protein